MAYWARIVVAYLLLSLAGKIMKDSENLVRATVETPVSAATEVTA